MSELVHAARVVVAKDDSAYADTATRCGLPCADVKVSAELFTDREVTCGTCLDNADYQLKDSGKRQEFQTGAVRDTQDGKGRYDLLPPASLFALARVFEAGAKKYSDRNWERGMPLSRYLDSAMRHLCNHLEGKRDEKHIVQAAWNLLAYIHTATMIERGLLPKKLNDLPNHTGRGKASPL